MMKAVLLGGTGFVGECLAGNLNQRKDCEVITVGRGISLNYVDCRDADVLVILTQPDTKIMAEVSDFIASSRKLKKVLYLSTLLLYPESDQRSTEEAASDPKTDYEKRKYQEESLLSDITVNTQIDLCIARLGNVYGNVKNKGIVNLILLSLIKKDKALVIQGDPSLKVRDYIFMEDVVNLLELLIFNNQDNQKEIFNICTGIGTNLLGLIREIELITGKQVKFEIKSPVLEKHVNIGDNSKILSSLNYKLKFSLNQGLKETYNNYLKFYNQ